MAMTLEKLKKMKESGTLDDEEFKDMLQKYNLKDDEEQPDADPLAGLDDKTKAAVQRMIQSEKDRAVNKLGNEKKSELEDLKKQLEDLKKAKLTDEEQKELERKQKEDELAKKEREFSEIQNKYIAAQELQKVQLESDEDVVNLVIGKDQETTKQNVATLNALVSRLVKKKVEEKFKENGRDPGKGSAGAGPEDNPWSKDHFNMTKQMEMEINDPDRAKTLKALAGIK